MHWRSEYTQTLFTGTVLTEIIPKGTDTIFLQLWLWWLFLFLAASLLTSGLLTHFLCFILFFSMILSHIMEFYINWRIFLFECWLTTRSSNFKYRAISSDYVYRFSHLPSELPRLWGSSKTVVLLLLHLWNGNNNVYLTGLEWDLN